MTCTALIPTLAFWEGPLAPADPFEVGRLSLAGLHLPQSQLVGRLGLGLAWQLREDACSLERELSLLQERLGTSSNTLTPGPHRVRQNITHAKVTAPLWGSCMYGSVHTEVLVHHHDRGWVPTPNVRWRMVRDALTHAVWLSGYPIIFRSVVLQTCSFSHRRKTHNGASCSPAASQLSPNPGFGTAECGGHPTRNPQGPFPCCCLRCMTFTARSKLTLSGVQSMPLHFASDLHLSMHFCTSATHLCSVPLGPAAQGTIQNSCLQLVCPVVLSDDCCVTSPVGGTQNVSMGGKLGIFQVLSVLHLQVLRKFVCG